jgi:hypothetical protein
MVRSQLESSKLISGSQQHRSPRVPNVGASLAQQQPPKPIPRANSSKDSDLMSSMTKRLSQLEALNKSFRSEIKELSEKNSGLKAQNETLKALTSPEAVQQLESIKKERDKYN